MSYQIVSPSEGFLITLILNFPINLEKISLTIMFAPVNIIYRRYGFLSKIETTEDKEGLDSTGVG